MSLAAVLALPTACDYDDSDLWEAVNGIEDRVENLEKASAQMNTDIKTLQSLLEAIQKNVFISAVAKDDEGYTIKFSDGTEARITNGVDGLSAPKISVRKAEDGFYYWTLDGEWLLDNSGNKVKAEGKDGENGIDGITPQLRINADTGEWEISTDEGATWVSTGVSAKGDSGDSIFAKVDTTNDDYVEFTLADGSLLRVQRYDAGAPLFVVEQAEGTQVIPCGESKTYTVKKERVASSAIAKPDGWRVSLSDNTLTITAPAENNPYAETEGSVDIMAVSESGASVIVRVQVSVYDRRVLTFEDADAKFPAYTLGYCSKTVEKWSDLIDSPQYGGMMLYGDSGYGMDEPYTWWDKGNTELKHEMCMAYGMYCYWGGGHAISNYSSTDLSQGDYAHQLMVYGAAGHNGSANFAVHFGYQDNSPYNMSETLPAFEFGDGSEHVIESIWIMNTVYAMNCYISGNGLTAKIGPDDWVKLVATGYDAAGNKTGEVTFYTCDGPDRIVRDWTRWDLTALGKVAKVEFNVTGSSDNGAGFSQPAYFAYDDVTVLF